MDAQTGMFKTPLLLGTGVGGVVKIVNPEGVDVIVKRAVVDITTGATASATMNVGISTSGSVGDNTILDALSIHTPGVFDNIKNPGSAGLPAVKWPAGSYLVATSASSAAGLVGNLYLDYFRL